jgi:Holliday junction DNA helicase RuvA
VGARVRLLTHHSVREDSEELFGFINADELRLFELLITIPGIGPKTALNILNVAPAETLRRSIRSGETAYLTKISGIGKKTADKIILELREKLGAGEETGLAEEVDALEALTALGYSQTQARDALKKVSPAITGASERIKHALKSLGK